MALRVSAKGKLSAALRNLCNHGVAALKPQLIENSKTRRATHWNPPAVSKRAANVLRKQAIQQGVYGSFDKITGVGWDPTWDAELAKTAGGRQTAQGRYQLRPSKQTERVRTREQRAQKIERNMQDMDQKIDQYYSERAAKKPVKDFEFYYKKHARKP